MPETYSLAATGARAGASFAVANIKVGDSEGLAGSQALAMSLGSPVLCKNADGSQSWYTLDAERSIGSSLVLKPL